MGVENALYKAKFGVTFKPFARLRRGARQKDGDRPFSIPESYDHMILLRKGISLAGMVGCIDLISEDPNALGSMFVARAPAPEKPLGPVSFTEIYHGPEDIEYEEIPSILRFSFLVRTPADYSKLLDSYADVQLGKEQYLLPWNVDRPHVKRNMQYLEENQGELVVVQKNLFNIKEMEETEESEEDGDADDIDMENVELGRIRFVWLPMDLKKYRTIAVTFNKIDHDDDDQPLPEPLTPEKEEILIPA